MPKNGIQDLRNHLFETLEALKTEDEHGKLMDIERAEAVCRVAETLIETAKVEVQFMKVAKDAMDVRAVDKNGFFKPDPVPQLPAGKPNGKLAA